MPIIKKGKNMKKISVVVPCYNEEKTINIFYEKTVPVLERTGYDFELIFVDDGSADKSLQVLKQLALTDERVKVLSFSRNFGQQAAIICGYKYSSGDAVMETDCDLQDPPEVMLEMVKKWEEGYQVVHGRRIERKGESFFKKATASAYYKFLSKITDFPVPRDTGDFKLYDRVVINSILAMPEKDKYIRGLASWVGFKQTFVDYSRVERVAGDSKYTLKKMAKLAKTGIVSNSEYPLYLSLKSGILGGVLSGVALLTFIVLAICGVNLPLTAWLFPTVILLFSLSWIFNSLSNIYISGIYSEVKKRPDYIVAESVNFDKDKFNG